MRIDVQAWQGRCRCSHSVPSIQRSRPSAQNTSGIMLRQANEATKPNTVLPKPPFLCEINNTRLMMLTRFRVERQKILPETPIEFVGRPCLSIETPSGAGKPNGLESTCFRNGSEALGPQSKSTSSSPQYVLVCVTLLKNMFSR